jgi:hypothetical protein
LCLSIEENIFLFSPCKSLFHSQGTARSLNDKNARHATSHTKFQSSPSFGFTSKNSTRNYLSFNEHLCRLCRGIQCQFTDEPCTSGTTPVVSHCPTIVGEGSGSGVNVLRAMNRSNISEESSEESLNTVNVRKPCHWKLILKFEVNYKTLNHCFVDDIHWNSELVHHRWMKTFQVFSENHEPKTINYKSF